MFRKQKGPFVFIKAVHSKTIWHTLKSNKVNQRNLRISIYNELSMDYLKSWTVKKMI